MRLDDAHHDYIEWLRTTRNLSAHTIRAYDGDVGALVRFLGKATPVDRITDRSLLDFVGDQRSAGVAETSLKRRCSGVRGFCRWMRSTGHIAKDPWDDVSLRIRRRRTLPRPVPTHAIERLLRRLNTDLDRDDLSRSTTLVGVALMLATGLRVGELVGLTVDDVDLDSRTIRVMGKGQRERLVFISNDWLARRVEQYLSERSGHATDHPFLLINRAGAPMSTAAMRRRLSIAAAESGLTERVTPHMLRHSAATQLIESGVDIRYVQRLLGHASLSTTEIYTHVADEALKRVVTEADVLGRSMDDN